MPAVSERPLTLAAGTAADLMRGDLSSLPRNATFSEAVAFFIDRNVTVAPVVGDRGEPVGVLSLTDLLIHVRAPGPGRRVRVARGCGRRTDDPDPLAVDARTPAAEVTRDMLRSAAPSPVCDRGRRGCYRGGDQHVRRAAPPALTPRRPPVSPTVMVPLDGSPAARGRPPLGDRLRKAHERGGPARQRSRPAGRRARRRDPRHRHPRRAGPGQQEAEYFAGVQARLKAAGVPVAADLLDGGVVSSLAGYAAKPAPGARVVMLSHARGAVGRFCPRRDGHRIRPRSPCPVLLVHEADEPGAAPTCGTSWSRSTARRWPSARSAGGRRVRRDVAAGRDLAPAQADARTRTGRLPGQAGPVLRRGAGRGARVADRGACGRRDRGRRRSARRHRSCTRHPRTRRVISTGLGQRNHQVVHRTRRPGVGIGRLQRNRPDCRPATRRSLTGDAQFTGSRLGRVVRPAVGSPVGSVTAAPGAS